MEKSKVKVMISQPMYGKTSFEIDEARKAATRKLEAAGYKVVNTLFGKEYFSEEDLECVKFKPLFYLAQALETMAMCDAVYFCKGWEAARGCRIEHEAAENYGLQLIYEDDLSNG